jgi:hypothetical protein
MEEAFAAQHTEAVSVKCARPYFAIALLLLAKAPKFVHKVMGCSPRECQHKQFGAAEACF